jgi:hypothetical protein
MTEEVKEEKKRPWYTTKRFYGAVTLVAGVGLVFVDPTPQKLVAMRFIDLGLVLLGLGWGDKMGRGKK